MPLTLESKKAVVEEVHAVARDAHSLVAAEYRGMSVAEMSQLRTQARQANVHLRVVRNTWLAGHSKTRISSARPSGSAVPWCSRSRARSRPRPRVS